MLLEAGTAPLEAAAAAAAAALACAFAPIGDDDRVALVIVFASAFAPGLVSDRFAPSIEEPMTRSLLELFLPPALVIAGANTAPSSLPGAFSGSVAVG